MEDDSDEELLDPDASSSSSDRAASCLCRCLEPLLRCELRWCPDATQEEDGSLLHHKVTLNERCDTFRLECIACDT